jgi:SAM-dependent methyltransferase
MSGHHHHHHHHDQPDWAARGSELIAEAELRAPMVDQALAWVAGRVPDAMLALDVGAGPGVAAGSLARLLPRAEVVAADGAAPLLELARARAEKLAVGQRFTTVHLSFPDGLAELPQADLVWISEVLHHLPDPVAALRALGRLVRPGGLLAVREGGLPLRFLPDGVAPGLLARLEAIGEERIAGGDHPGGIVPHRGSWPDLMRQAGLRPAGSRSFLLDLPAPVGPEARGFLHGRLTRWLEIAGERLTEADRGSLQALLEPDGVLGRDDIFLLSAGTVHTAQF